MMNLKGVQVIDIAPGHKKYIIPVGNLDPKATFERINLFIRELKRDVNFDKTKDNVVEVEPDYDTKDIWRPCIVDPVSGEINLPTELLEMKEDFFIPGANLEKEGIKFVPIKNVKEVELPTSSIKPYIVYWPFCSEKGCTNKICLALKSDKCFTHTKGNKYVKRFKIWFKNTFNR